METQSPVTFRQVIKNRRFLALWLAHFVSTFGDWLAVLALLSLVAFRRHGTSYEVSSILVAYVLPVAVVGPVAGVFVDRWDLKATMIGSDLVRAALAVLLALPAGLYPLYFLVFALSAVSCFFFPAQTAILPLIVDRRELLVANAANTQTTTLNKVISPALAGLLIARLRENACFYIDSATFLISAALLSTMSVRRGSVDPDRTVKAVPAELKDGIRFVVRTRVIRFLAVSMAAAILSVGLFDALIAVFVRDMLGGSSEHFGLLVSLVGAGTIVGAAVVGRFGQRWRKLDLVLLGILALGAGVLTLAALTRISAALACSFGLGFAVAGVMIPSQSLLQEETPHGMLGRASSAINSLLTAGQVLGFVAAGALAAWLGVRSVYGLAGLGLILIACVGYASSRAGMPSARAGEAGGGGS